jgi:DNA-binding CsgD family transcriptional regulator
MLLGRDPERLALDHLLARARSGQGGVLALVGEPGIGKTVLLEYAAQQAAGMGVLRARGVESEAEIPFAGLSELLRPALRVLDRIPEPQAAALAGALALGPGTAQDRFAVGAATLSLLSAFAEDAPLAVLVDDVHQLDGSSAGALLFAARRLVADPVAIVLTVREGEPSLLDGADLRVLRVAGLDRADAVRLLAGAGVDEPGVERLHRATGGNPLALIELAPEAARMPAVPGVAPLPISTSIAAAFVRRLGEVPERVRVLLVLAAAAHTGDLAILDRAANALGLDTRDLAAAEEAGLVRLTDGEVAFRHPLARSAVYGDARPQERRAAHAAVAAALPTGDVDSRAWHLAAAAIGPDAAASAALAQAGDRARARTAYAVAAEAFRRGAQLTASPPRRGQLLLAAAENAWLGGDPQRCVGLLDDARATVADPALAARIDQLHGHVDMRCGPIMDGYRRTVAAAEGIAAADPELAVVMLAEAVHAAFCAGDTPAMLAAAERAVALERTQESRRAAYFAAMAHGIALVAAGQGEAGAAAVRRAVAILEASEELRDDPRLLVWVAFGPLWLREVDVGRGLIDETFERARRQAALGVLAATLPYVARDQATTDRWSAAETSYDEAIRFCRETGQRTDLGMAIAGAALLEARQGRERACREHATEAAELCERLGMGVHGVWATLALGDLELGLGRPAAAVVHHEHAAVSLAEHGIADVDLSPAPELVDAYLRLGKTERAEAVAAEFIPRADAKGQPWVMARAVRCRGMLAREDDVDACFTDALALHAQTPDGFETARTHLAYGSRLRRLRRRADAREQLGAALEIFDRLGAEPWGEQAGAELAATGKTARRRDPSTLDDLTPQELQIARLLAEGRTTREAAAAVFLSPKTIEYHLRNVYVKLGVRSREALAQAMGVERAATR